MHKTAAVQALHRCQHAFRKLEEIVQADAALLHQGDEVRPEELHGAQDSACARSALCLLMVMQSLHRCLVPAARTYQCMRSQNKHEFEQSIRCCFHLSQCATLHQILLHDTRGREVSEA